MDRGGCGLDFTSAKGSLIKSGDITPCQGILKMGSNQQWLYNQGPRRGGIQSADRTQGQGVPRIKNGSEKLSLWRSSAPQPMTVESWRVNHYHPLCLSTLVLPTLSADSIACTGTRTHTCAVAHAPAPVFLCLCLFARPCAICLCECWTILAKVLRNVECNLSKQTPRVCMLY